MAARIKHTLKLLDKGPDVAALQRALAAARLPIAEEERRQSRFGLSTRQALTQFQTQANLRATGLLDAATADALNRVAVAPGVDVLALPESHRPFRRLTTLGQSVRTFRGRDERVGDAVRSALTVALKDRLVEAFESPSERLTAAVTALEIDLDEVEDMSVRDLVFSRIVPELAADPQLNRELTRHVDRGFDVPSMTVSELLGMDGDARESAVLAPLVNRARNEALADIVGANTRVMAALDTVNLLADREALDRLVTEGTLTPAQRDELRSAVAFARLTDDNFAAVRALHRDGARTPRDLASRDRAGWTTFITANNIEPPKGETVDSYAELLEAGIERAVPTAYAMERFAVEPPRAVLDRILRDGENDRDERDRFANRYAALGVRDILDDASTGRADKRTRITRRTRALARAWTARPDLDLDLAHFLPLADLVARQFVVALDDVDEEDRPHVRAALMAVQRVRQLTENWAEADRLLSAGLDTARGIAAFATADQLAGRSGLSRGSALRIRARALETQSHVAHVVQALQDADGSSAFDPAALREADAGPDLGLINVLREIPGYSDLFGNQNYCKCRHCQSILSPAAYFVDLMTFIEKTISRPNFIDADRADHALFLRNRRGDLWNLPLTCENTDTPEIYLTIVNEVLSAFLDQMAPLAGDVFEALATDARSSFRQPFNLPFAEVILYLGHLGVELPAVSSLFDETEAAAPHAVLRISPEEFSTIAAADLSAVDVRYGQPEDLRNLDASMLVRRTGIDRSLLGRVLDVRFVRAGLDVTTRIESVTGDLIGFVERIELRAGSSFVSVAIATRVLDRLHRFVRLQRALGWTPEEVQLVLDLFTPANLRAAAGNLAAQTALGQVLNPDTLARISDVVSLKDRLKLSVSEAVALVSEIPGASAEPGGKSLYTSLFGTREELTVRHPALGNAGEEPPVSSDFGVLQGALRTEESDLIDLIRRRLPASVIAAGVLNRGHLASLYRGVRLARALALTQRELAALEQIRPGLVTLEAPEAAITTLIAATRVVETARTLPLSMSAIAELLLSSASAEAARAEAIARLTALAEDVRSHDRLVLTPLDLTTIELITADTARVVLDHLTSRAEPWLTRPDAASERYLLTAAVGTVPDEAVLIEALTTEGGPLAGADLPEASVSGTVQAVAALLAQRHPVVITAAGIGEQLRLSEEFVAAAAPLVGHLPPLGELGQQVAAWLGGEDEAIPEPLIDRAVALARLMRLFKDSLSADNGAVAFVAGHQDLFAITPDSDWNWETLRRLGAYVMRRKAAAEDAAALDRAIEGWNGEAFAAGSADDLASVFDVPVGKLSALAAELPPLGDPFSALMRIDRGLRLASRLGLDPVALGQLTAQTFSGLSAARNLIYGAMRAKHETEDAWLAVSEPFREKVEGIKRDALVDRILSREFQLRFRNARDIYHFFLLDAEMDGVARTSRVKAAISSCQLYVQRCLMGLEQDRDGDVVVTIAGKHSRDEWAWRKSYRVWQANREIFTYCENYLLPDLRDDKSHLFRLTEAELLQSRLDAAAMERIYASYLSGFTAIGSLVVVNGLFDLEEQDYVLFGRTQSEPFRYFLRRFDGNASWTPWEPIDVEVGAATVTAAKKRGKLYLFWTNVVKNTDGAKVMAANASSNADDENRQESVPVTVTFSTRDAAGRWSAPLDLLFYNLPLFGNAQVIHELLDLSETMYGEFPHSSTFLVDDRNEHRIRIVHACMRRLGFDQFRQYAAYLDETRNRLVLHDGRDVPALPGSGAQLGNTQRFASSGLQADDREIFPTSLLVRNFSIDNQYPSGLLLHESLAAADYHQTHIEQGFGLILPVLAAARPSPWVFKSIQNQSLSTLLHTSGQQFLVRWRNQPGYKRVLTEPLDPALALLKSRRILVRLSTALPESIAEALELHGLDDALSPKTQALPEPSTVEAGLDYEWVGELRPPFEEPLVSSDRTFVQFDSAHGSYLWETFFHIPFLVAHYLNSLGKFAEADRWYRYIFDPINPAEDTKGPWRFRPFKKLKAPTLRAILTQEAAITAYKRDPFNPFAIARLRPSAFQKAVVMRYIDNLLDWGDQLFRRDTLESLNEATLLYVVAADVLGERPIEVGECETAPADSLTYAAISTRNVGNEFLIELENIIYYYVNFSALAPPSPARTDIEFTPFHLPGSEPDEPEEPAAPGSGFAVLAAEAQAEAPALAELQTRRSAFVRADNLAIETPAPDPPLPGPGFPSVKTVLADVPDPDGPVQDARRMGFCVPPNDTLLGYWDRVDDRLFKIRHCMNIDGIVRKLPLWEPRIDPALLVRAKAAGLEIDDVLALLNEQPPQHRFELLVEHARRFTATAQQLGSQLLSAIERKDESELTLLKAVHEDSILTLARSQRQNAVDEATAMRAHLTSVQASVQTRLDHFNRLISEATADVELGLNKEEADGLAHLQEAKDSQDSAGEEESKAHKVHAAGPQWSLDGSASLGGGFAFSIAAGPVANVVASASVGYGSSNLEARHQRSAFRHRDTGRKSEAEAGRATSRAGYARRLENWIHECDMAQAELDALEPQFLAADFRTERAEQELQLHDTQIEHSKEVFEFAKDRFSNLGLYTYLSTHLSRLHRSAYDMAHKMAVSAERAYRFETGDEKFFLEGDNWDASRAGLLAADRLLLQLQAMEASFLERDRQEHEITLACSLTQIDPDAVVRLRQTGRTNFPLPEWWFDLYYPGQFRRTIRAVRLSIPGVIGPSVNVGARLTLMESAMRITPNSGTAALRGVQVGRNASVVTSTANADAGVFELRFDGPKHPPFRGAGAISSWTLDLPRTKRAFDYASISDVVVHVSYTAMDDGVYRAIVEGESDTPGTIDAMLAAGAVRILSLRRDFPTEFHRLMHAAPLNEGATIRLSRDHFPFWLSTRRLDITGIDIALEAGSGAHISASELQGVVTATLNGVAVSEWDESPNLSLPASSHPLNDTEFDGENLEFSLALEGADRNSIADVLLRLHYAATE